MAEVLLICRFVAYGNGICYEHERDRSQHLAHVSHEFSCRLISHFMQPSCQEA